MFPLWLVGLLIVLILAGAACAAFWLVNQPGSGGDFAFATPFGCLGIAAVAVVLVLVVLTVKGIVGW